MMDITDVRTCQHPDFGPYNGPDLWTQGDEDPIRCAVHSPNSYLTGECVWEIDWFQIELLRGPPDGMTPPDDDGPTWLTGFGWV